MGYTNYGGQSYNSLKNSAKQSGQLFKDPLFPPENKSLFFSRSEPPFPVEWKRPKELSNEAHLFVDGASSADVSQGRLGNCWFVAASASLAQEKDLLRKVIPSHKEQEFNSEKPEDYQGIFKFRFWRFGEWIEVVIDDLLPTSHGELIYVRSKDKNEFWSALLEKAYAKLAGSYEALEAGNPAEALVDFTGGVSETINLLEEKFNADLDKRKILFQKLEKLMDRQSMTSASIKVVDRQEMEKQLDNGLVKGHAYGITAVKKIRLGGSLLSSFNRERLFMIRLRNPWGEKEWTGAWSDESDEWKKVSKSEKDKLGIVFENDGEFWMDFLDFCTNFTSLTICRLVNTSFFSIHKTWHEGSHINKWVTGKSAGGCVNNKTSFLTNPQYRIDVTGGELEPVMVSLMQKDKRREKSTDPSASNLTMGFFIMRVEANREYRCHSIYEKSGDSVFINSREVFARIELAPGRYVIVPSTFEANVDGDFLLRVYTDHTPHFKFLALDKPEPGFFSCMPCASQPTCQLSVFVMDVTGLKKRGGASITLDPYVELEIEGKKVTTPTRYDTDHPKFETGGLFYVNKPQTSQLTVKVWDHNTVVRDTFLGQVLVPLTPNDKTMLETHPLKDRGAGASEATGGTITLRVTCSRSLDFV